MVWKNTVCLYSDEKQASEADIFRGPFGGNHFIEIFYHAWINILESKSPSTLTNLRSIFVLVFEKKLQSQFSTEFLVFQSAEKHGHKHEIRKYHLIIIWCVLLLPTE